MGSHAPRVMIGERRRPNPRGQPGFVRVDTVHQGDLDGVKGVYHINDSRISQVDEVTQYESGQPFLLPVLSASVRRTNVALSLIVAYYLRQRSATTRAGCIRDADTMTPYDKFKSLDDVEQPAVSDSKQPWQSAMSKPPKLEPGELFRFKQAGA